IIHIDEEKCNGCGLCIPNCPEGALQIIDEKVRLVSDLFCDGLGACIGHCPEGAISIEKREAEIYNERKVMDNVVKQGKATIVAHLEHLQSHGESDFLQEALDYLEEQKIEVDFQLETPAARNHSCPGSQMMDLTGQPAGKERSAAEAGTAAPQSGSPPSELRQWPVQLHLLPVAAPYLKGADLLLAADCVAYAVGDFHRDYLYGKRLAIACPKLDSNQEIYRDVQVAPLPIVVNITSLVTGPNLQVTLVPDLPTYPDNFLRFYGSVRGPQEFRPRIDFVL
ncbi:hypothetical protein LCGC14_2861040, partial [marine sediment metagenome]